MTKEEEYILGLSEEEHLSKIDYERPEIKNVLISFGIILISMILGFISIVGI